MAPTDCLLRRLAARVGSRRAGGLAGLGLGFLTALATAAATNPPAPADSGFTYHHDVVRQGPWSIHIAKVALGQPGWELHTTLGGGPTFGMSVVSEQIRSLPPSLGRPVAAINGDFFRAAPPYAGDPEGLQIMRGELVSGPMPTRICFWVDTNGVPRRGVVTAQFKVTWPNGATTPFGLNEELMPDTAVLYTSVVGESTHTRFGRELVLERAGPGPWLPLQPGVTYAAKVRQVRTGGDSRLTPDVMVLALGTKRLPQLPTVTTGAVLQISTALTPDLRGVKTAMGGGPSLVRAGKPGDWRGLPLRHPRSAIGWNKDFFFMVEVDGRQSTSVGMTYSELAAYLAKLGCQEAINLDGGGSATLWVNGRVMNNPSSGSERAAANALALVRKPDK